MTATASRLPFDLQLLPRAGEPAATQAVFILGASAEEWLALLAPAAGRMLSLEVLIVPQSIADLRPLGLLVLGPIKLIRELPGLPLQRLADRLYIPVDASLRWPATEIELAAALPTSLCLLLPSCGFIGFEDRDRLRVTDFVELSLERDRRWSAARPGLTELPPVGTLRPLQPALDAPSIASMLAAPGISSPPKPKRPPKKGGGSRGGRPASNEDSEQEVEEPQEPEAGAGDDEFLEEDDDETPTAEDLKEREERRKKREAREREAEGAGGNSLWKRFVAWISGDSQSPKKAPPKDSPPQSQPKDDKAPGSIEELLKLFEKNIDEGLRYAIPIDDEPRSAPPTQATGSLQRREFVDFDLNHAKAGRPRAGWSVEQDKAAALRRQYLNAANREMRLGRHRRAAFIYSQLLKDNHNAALVLRDGGHYIEAGRLFEESLKSDRDAADCYERGGEPERALRCLQRYGDLERVAELQLRMGLKDEAEKSFRQAAQRLASRGNRMGAARLLRSRLNDDEAALETLAPAWPDEPSASECLSMRFEILDSLGRKSAIEAELSALEKQPLSPIHVLPLSRVTANLTQTLSAPGLRERASDLTRVLISRRLAQASGEEFESLIQTLKESAPDDLVLTGDAERARRSLPRARRNPLRLKDEVTLLHQFRLPPARWLRFGAGEKDYYGVGLTESGETIAVRFFEDGLIQKLLWAQSAADLKQAPLFAVPPSPTAPVALRFPDGMRTELRRFPPVAGQSPEIGIPSWLGPQAISLCYDDNGRAWVLRKTRDDQFVLNSYDPVSGKLLVGKSPAFPAPSDDQDPFAPAKPQAAFDDEQPPWVSLGLSMLHEQSRSNARHSELSFYDRLAAYWNEPTVSSVRRSLLLTNGPRLIVLNRDSFPDTAIFESQITQVLPCPRIYKIGAILVLAERLVWLPNLEELSRQVEFGQGAIERRVAITRSGTLVVAGKAARSGRIEGHTYQFGSNSFNHSGNFEFPGDDVLEVLPGRSAETVLIITASGRVLLLRVPPRKTGTGF